MARSADTPPLDYPLTSKAALEPPEEWAGLREGCPVARVTLPSGDEATLLTRYDDVRAALSDPGSAGKGWHRRTRRASRPGTPPGSSPARWRGP